MMADWIRRAERITKVEYRHQFDWPGRPSCGFAFPCDEQGIVPEDMNPAARANYEACLTGLVDGQPIIDEGITRDEWTYTEPGAIRCDCGAEVVLDMVMTNTCTACRRCGEREGFSWHQQTAEDCERYMSSHGMAGCGRPSEHHEYTACNTDYNSSGQRLAPREQWGWDTGELLCEILSSDWPVGTSPSGDE